MEVVCLYCNAELAVPPPDGVCPACSEPMPDPALRGGIAPTIAKEPDPAPPPAVLENMASENDSAVPNASIPGLQEFLALVGDGPHLSTREELRVTNESRNAAVSPAQELQCPHCHSVVVAASDELCPECGDVLEAPGKELEPEPPVTKPRRSTPAPAAEPVTDPTRPVGEAEFVFGSDDTPGLGLLEEANSELILEAEEPELLLGDDEPELILGEHAPSAIGRFRTPTVSRVRERVSLPGGKKPRNEDSGPRTNARPPTLPSPSAAPTAEAQEHPSTANALGENKGPKSR